MFVDKTKSERLLLAATRTLLLLKLTQGSATWATADILVQAPKGLLLDRGFEVSGETGPQVAEEADGQAESGQHAGKGKAAAARGTATAGV